MLQIFFLINMRGFSLVLSSGVLEAFPGRGRLAGMAKGIWGLVCSRDTAPGA